MYEMFATTQIRLSCERMQGLHARKLLLILSPFAVFNGSITLDPAGLDSGFFRFVNNVQKEYQQGYISYPIRLLAICG